MKNWSILAILLLPLLGASQTGQTPMAKLLPKVHIPQGEENITRLKEINRDIWTPFSEAYAANDVDKYISLHLPDFVRANGGDDPKVRDIDAYRASIERGFKWNLENNRGVEISFTFFERATSDKAASERGIYRYTSTQANGDTQNFYGKFHVIHRKVDGKWKIAVDYDSDEDGTIGEEDFKAGLPPERYQ